ncbi:hypothetical protein DL96DRAFT_1607726 [Flagelloscypha sp. PMI_526]|nr:hypothetical protein DL96DRAFT_1607726 [Flagelloscypha sp. PMI_526]
MKETYPFWLLHPFAICVSAFSLGFPCAAISGAIVRAIGGDVNPAKITVAYCLGMSILAVGCGVVVWPWRKYCL